MRKETRDREGSAPPEHIMVFPAKLLEEIGAFQGVSTELDRYLPRILHPDVYSYRLRGDVEGDPSFKQVIPYVLMRCGDSFLRYRRGRGLGEKRLHDYYSIGIGGHVSRQDANLFEGDYEEGVRRELAEEVRIDSPYAERKVAMINDDATDVGKVHFGVVHLLELEEPRVSKRERSMRQLGFVSRGELSRVPQSYESWSRILIRDLLGSL